MENRTRCEKKIIYETVMYKCFIPFKAPLIEENVMSYE